MTIKEAKEWLTTGNWQCKVDNIVKGLKEDWGGEWHSKLNWLCADRGDGSIYGDILPAENIDMDAPDSSEVIDILIDAIDAYIDAAYPDEEV